VTPNADYVGRVVLYFSLDAIELRQRVAEAIAADSAMFLGPEKLRLLLGEPSPNGSLGMEP
jgi:hypothetical protein